MAGDADGHRPGAVSTTIGPLNFLGLTATRGGIAMVGGYLAAHREHR